MRALRRKPALGAPGLVGQTGVVREALAPVGTVLVRGELWRAMAANEAPIDAGRAVRVTDVDGLTLTVAKVDGGERG